MISKSSLVFQALILFSLQTIAQSQKIDSLKRVLDQPGIATKDRINTTNAIGMEYCLWMDSSSTFFYCRRAENLSRRENYTIGVADSYHVLGQFHLQKGNLEKAKEYYEMLISSSLDIGYVAGLSNGYNGLGYIYSQNGDYGKALKNLRQSLSFREKTEDNAMIANSLMSIGQVYYDEGFSEEAKSYLSDSKRIFKKLNMKSKENDALIYLAKVAIDEEAFDLASIYLNRALQTNLNPIQKVRIYDTYGTNYLRQGQYDSARKYYYAGLEVSRKYDFPVEVATMCIQLGQISLGRDSLDKARRAIELGIGKNNYILTRYPDKYQEALLSLAQIEFRLGNHKLSSLYFLEHKKRSDSLDYKKDLKYLSLIKADLKYKSEMDSLRMSIKEEKIVDKARQERNYIIQSVAFILIILLSILLMVIYRLYKSKQNSALYLDQLNRTQSKLFGIIAHDIRNPMNIIHGLLDLIDFHTTKHYPLDKELHMMNKNIRNACSRVVALFEDLLQWSMKNQGKINYSPKNHCLQELIESSLEVWCTYAQLKQITISLDIDPHVDIFVDKSSFITIVRNLVGNALKFTPKNGTIKIDGENENSFVKIQIVDSGVGMESGTISKILSSAELGSEKGTEGEEGSGFGLDLVKDFIKMNKGVLGIESQLGSGTTVEIIFPRGNTNLELAS